MIETRRAERLDSFRRFASSVSTPILEDPEARHDATFIVHEEHGHLLFRSHLTKAHRERNHPCIKSLAAAFSPRTNILRS